MKLLLTGAFKYTEAQIKELEELGYTCLYMQDEKQKVEFEEEIEAIVCNGFFLYHDIKKFKNLKCIQLTSAGLDRVPLEYIKENKLALYNAKGVYSIPMAEWTILKILEIYKNSKYFYEKQKEHLWEKNRELFELAGKKAVIIGAGSIGKEIAKRLKAFEVNISAVDLYKTTESYIDKYYPLEKMNEALTKSDIIILTLPLNEKTQHMINKENIKLMKENSILINISRGGIIKEEDLISEIKKNKFLGVILDVFEKEPLDENSELWDFNNVIVTPHNSFVSEGNNKRMFRVIKENLANWKKEH